MTHGPPMALPPGRVLLGWWRELAPVAPRRMWFAHLVLHRVEVLVEADAARPLAPLARALRARLDAGARPEGLAAELAVDAALVARALAEPCAEGGPGRRRGTFWFTDRPVQYVPLTGEAAAPLAAPADWQFDPALLDECVSAPEDWKAQHGFPSGVRAVVREGGGWESVVYDRAEQALLCLAERGDGALVGHATRAESWELGRPVLALPGAAWVAPLVGELGAEAVRAAWQGWCQRRSLPSGEVEACDLELAGHRLLVRAPAGLVERLRSTRSEALRGEAWLLVGPGRARQAVRVEVAG